MPQPGSPMPTGYIYLEVPFSSVRQQTPSFGIFASSEPYISIEAFAKGRGIFGVYRKDLVDRSRVYRFPNTARGHFSKNKYRPEETFIQVGVERFLVLDSDPSLGKGVARDFTPLG